MKKLSIVIPSFKRTNLLYNQVDNIIHGFNTIGFDDYEIVCVVSGTDQHLTSIHDNVKILNFMSKRLYPGIARNLGLKEACGEWIWFVDDDDDIIFSNIHVLINNMDLNFDLIGHSFKSKYNNNDKNTLLKNISTFRENQEVFNFLIAKSFLEKSSIRFSDGLHEDIRFLIEMLIADINILILKDIVYKKLTKEDSITFEISKERIDGYLNSIIEIISINDEQLNHIKGEIVTQCIGTILYLINNSSDTIDKHDYIYYTKSKLSENILNHINEKYTYKNTNFKYAVSILLDNSDNEIIVRKLNDCFNSYLSCKDLKNSIFFGPNEIIGCCKRFFHKEKMKGDIILMPNSEDISLKKILDRKKEVEELINRELFEDCEGCPYIERYEKEKDEKINYISLENFTYCNMRCSYCSPKYYGGKEATYNTESLIQELLKGNYLSENTQVVWGGGEPTLKPKFREINENFIQDERISKIRILSNSLRYSQDLFDLISNNKIRLVTSIDAGTQDKFKQIRGKGEIEKVLENLSNYQTNTFSTEHITIKYIVTEENYFQFEIKKFVELIKKYHFEKNPIQISCNFKIKNPTKEMTWAIYELAARLLKNNFQFVYFDDLIRDRLDLKVEETQELIEYLQDNKLMHENIVSHLSDIKVILFGNGYQSKWISNKTNFGKSNKILQIVSNKEELDSIDIQKNTIIYPSGVQSIMDIYNQLKNSKFENITKFLIFI